MKLFKSLFLLIAFFATNALSAPILIGQTADFSNAAAPILKEFAVGAKAYFEKVNASGGVDGDKIELISLDDGFDPDRTVANALKLIENPNIVALFGSRGTPNLTAMLPMAEAIKIPVVASLIGANVVRDKKYTVSFPLRATYSQEADIGLKAIWPAKKIAIVYPDDAYGKEMRDYVTSKVPTLEQGPSIVAEISFNRLAKSFKEQVKELGNKAPEAVMLFGSANACAEFLREWAAYRKETKLPMMRFVTNSIVDLQAQRGVIGDAAEFVSATQVIPSPTKFGKIQGEYAKALKGKAPSYPSYEGWMSAHVLVEAMKKAKKPLTRSSLLASLNTLKVEMDYGFTIDFNTRYDNVARFVDLITVDSTKAVVR